MGNLSVAFSNLQPLTSHLLLIFVCSFLMEISFLGWVGALSGETLPNLQGGAPYHTVPVRQALPWALPHTPVLPSPMSPNWPPTQLFSCPLFPPGHPSPTSATPRFLFASPCLGAALASPENYAPRPGEARAPAGPNPGESSVEKKNK